jgi:phosphoadenosine phosphosulfate reductase
MAVAPDRDAQERLVMDDYEAGEWATYFDLRQPEDLLEWAFGRFHPYLAIVSSFQAESVVLIDMAYHINPEVRVITVDTGRLPQETYDLIDKIRQRYGIQVEALFPDAAEVEAMVRRHGMNLFYQSVPLRLLCCHIRKVLPLARALRGLDAWVTGLRREQWATRANIRKVEIDHDHGGIVKLNPLADWTHEDVWAYIREFDLPYNKLYDQGYTSIGCAPCCRPVQPGEDPRSGRWWWETNAPKECGMHCPIETGGFEHEVEAILGEAAHLRQANAERAET